MTLLIDFSCVDKILNGHERCETHECQVKIPVDLHYIYIVDKGD